MSTSPSWWPCASPRSSCRLLGANPPSRPALHVLSQPCERASPHARTCSSSSSAALASHATRRAAAMDMRAREAT